MIKTLLSLALMCAPPATSTKPTVEQKPHGNWRIVDQHQQMLYPVVRVTFGNNGGSGTVLYSEDRGDGCQTYVLTNHHVISAAIRIGSEWSSLLQADRKRESLEPVKIEVFRYARGSTQDVTDTYQGEIVAHDRNHDLALVKLKSSRRLRYVAKLLPVDDVVQIFQPCWAVGCSLLHPPVATAGHINYLDDVINRKVYWMASAQIILGNSGGAVYVESEGNYWFVGVPSRLGRTRNQFVSHMGWFVPIPRIREWAKDEKLLFLIDSKAKPGDCFKLREELRKKAELQFLLDKSRPN